MKFKTFIRCIREVTDILSEDDVPVDDVMVYFKLDGKLHICDGIELRYSEEIDKYAFIGNLKFD